MPVFADWGQHLFGWLVSITPTLAGGFMLAGLIWSSLLPKEPTPENPPDRKFDPDERDKPPAAD